MMFLLFYIGIKMTTIIFLGTGGGRFATIYQIRATGGIYIDDGACIHLDPGPTALMNLRRAHLDPAKTDAVLISHCHPDHYADAEIVIEGMARGGFKKRGLLVGSKSAIDGTPDFSPAVSAYHRTIPEKALSVETGSQFNVLDLRVEATHTLHSDPTGVGFKFHTSSGVISYVGDTERCPEIAEQHQGSRVLILNLTRPLRSRVPMHLATEDAAILAAEIRPELVVLTHFGMKLIHDGVDVQARYIEESSNVPTIPAEDLMTLCIDKKIRISRPDDMVSPLEKTAFGMDL
jgi:ribonuclease BN (tRNA processing enzyme)